MFFDGRYSKKYEANIFFKREDLQEVRSYKIRGAYNKMS
ncbi:Threonine dehydratase [Croceitalea dokdonensis DOKDO 023]|uniref:Threonine dehydratase n=1 Tax=Croceitalea dokdonensis DOKDO 023 TaxID=1300341 RepID=A0A0P7A5X8_9FLAO|nr:Threonine dehydratase [Croceitalea dokdonensis DOKDO 023]